MNGLVQEEGYQAAECHCWKDKHTNEMLSLSIEKVGEKMFAALLLLSAAPLLVSSALCALPSSYKPTLTDSCSAAFSAPSASLSAARGELESVAVLLDSASASVAEPTLDWDAGSAPAGVTLSVRLLTYMHTEASPRYAGSAAGWYAEALLPWPLEGVSVGPGGNVAAWLTLNVSASAAPGVYSGLVRAGGASLPLSLQVFALALPPLGQSPFKSIYAFDASILPRAYQHVQGFNASATRSEYWARLAASRFPATNIYAQQPLTLAEYAELAALGSNVLILADISSLPGSPYLSARRTHSAQAQAGPGAGAGSALAACPTFSPAYIASMVALLNATWVGLQGLGLAHLATVYGFDEIDAACEPSVRALFSAAKAAFPGVRTLSAIDWATVPLDLPLDTWILQYQLVQPSVAAAWVGAGHELGVYHCIEPSQPGFLNTFIERDLIEARLLFWYDFVLGVSAHLYYDVALWANWQAVPPFWAFYTTASNVTHPVALAPLAVAQQPADQRLLPWDPSVWVWAPDSSIWANGDGVYVYPGAVQAATGVGAMVSTVRLEAQRDGVEDWHVFSQVASVKGKAAVLAMVTQLVSAPTVFSRNCTLLQQVRRALLELSVD